MDYSLRNQQLGAMLKARREARKKSDYPHYRPSLTAKGGQIEGLTQKDAADMLGLKTWTIRKLEQGDYPYDKPLPMRNFTAYLDLLAVPPYLREKLLTANTTLPPDAPRLRPTETPDPETFETLRSSIRPLDYPATILNERWDILGWNRAAILAFFDFEQVIDETPNLLWLIFTNHEVKLHHVHWEDFARELLTHFRTTWAAHRNDPRFDELIERLRVASREFDDWWENDYYPSWVPDAIYELDHPQAGRMTFRRTALVHQQGLIVAYFRPLEREDTIRKMDQLLRSDSAH